MRNFKDTTGRAWNVELTVGGVEKIQAALGVNLFGVLDPDSGLFDRLMQDGLLAGQALWILVEPQAAASNIDRAKFLDSLSGDEFGAGREAWVGAVIDFFPTPLRVHLRRLAEEVEAARRENLEKATVTPPQ